MQLHAITFLLHCLPNAYPCESPLDFWRVKSSDYPTLASLVHQVFSEPATSGPVERVFSQAGKIFKSTTMLHDSKELCNTAIFEDELPVYVTLMQL